MKIRLTGLPAECDAVVALLSQVADRGLTIVDVSTPYPCRGSSALVRVYVEARLHHQNEEATGRGRRADG